MMIIDLSLIMGKQDADREALRNDARAKCRKAPLIVIHVPGVSALTKYRR